MASIFSLSYKERITYGRKGEILGLAFVTPENMIDTWKDDIGNIPSRIRMLTVSMMPIGTELRTRGRNTFILFWHSQTQPRIKQPWDYSRSYQLLGEYAAIHVSKSEILRFVYNYLIHDTEDCRKKGKHLYKASERITGNNFDIGSFEQLSTEDKRKMADEIEDFIYEHNIYNYADLNYYVKNNFDSQYREVIKSYSGHFDRLCKGMYLRIFSQKKA